jgi:hypothetical protein
MTSFLEVQDIDTIISAITMDSESSSTAQLNLIAAAEKSSVTKRFIPSEYGGKVDEEVAKLDPYANFWIDNAKALAKTRLQYTRIAVGFFMDYWGMPHIDTAMTPFKWAMDVENGIACIPGTGDELLSMTYSRDLAKFIVRLLDEDEWPVQCAVIGQDVTFNQILKWVEDATGRKFKVSYDSMEKLERGEVTPLSDEMASQQTAMQLSVIFDQMVLKGYILVSDEKGYRLNERFADLTVLTVEKMIEQVWNDAPGSGQQATGRTNLP